MNLVRGHALNLLTCKDKVQYEDDDDQEYDDDDDEEEEEEDF
jgi:hypothetical protein